jgi:hypothetical protein
VFLATNSRFNKSISTEFIVLTVKLGLNFIFLLVAEAKERTSNSFKTFKLEMLINDFSNYPSL